MCHCCGEKGHCASDCPMNGKTAKNDWAIKKGMQMVQGLNNEASKVSQESTSLNNDENKEEKKKQAHWSGAQMQGFQTHTHTHT